MPNIWPTKQVRDNFFEELRALIERYPTLADRMARSYAEDPADLAWGEIGDGYPAYDPASPMFLQGIVVLVSYCNLEHFENLTILDPFEQSHYMTAGMVDKAAVLIDGSNDDL